nr:LysR substrate-binding domain-containing protein [Enterovibrio coralii]
MEISVSDAAVNIIDDGFDVGIRFGHKIEEGMIARPLTKDCREALFASPAYVEKHGAPKTLQDLQQHKQIQYRFITSNQLAPLVLTDNGEQVTVAMPASLIVNDTDLMVDAATKGLGIGRLVEPVVEEQLKQQTLIPILEQHWHTYPGMYVYFHQNTQKAKRVRVLIDFLVARMNG